MTGRGALLVVLAATAILLGPGAAAADAAPTAPSQPCGPSPSLPTGPVTGTVPPVTQVPPCTRAAAKAPPGGGVLGPINGGGRDSVPLDHYDIMYSQPGLLDDGAFSTKVLGILIDGTFTATKIVVGFTAWFLQWILDFELAATLLEPISHMAQVYQQQIVERIGLPGFFLTLAVFWFGLMIVRGKVGKGVGEIAVSILLYAMTGTVLAQPATLLLGPDGLLGQAKAISVELAALPLADGQSDPGRAGEASGLQDALIHTFIREPHQLLNYGQNLEDAGKPDPCLKVYNEIVKSGPHGTDDEPRDQMGECNAGYAEYNKTLTWDKLGGAITILIAAIIVGFLLLLIAAAFGTLQLILAALAGGAPLVLAVSLIGGPFRRALWTWCGAVASALVSICAVGAFLGFTFITIGALLTASGMPLIVRMVLVILTALAAVILHGRLLKWGRNVGRRATRHLERMRIGGSGRRLMHTGPWNMRTLWRESRSDLDNYYKPMRSAIVGSPTSAARRPRQGDGKATKLLRRTRAGRITLRSGQAIKGTAKYTVGAPVYGPRAAKTVLARTKAKKAALDTKIVAAKAFGKQYAHNTGTEWVYDKTSTAAKTTAQRTVPGLRTAAALVNPHRGHTTPPRHHTVAAATAPPRPGAGPGPGAAESADPGAVATATAQPTTVHRITAPAPAGPAGASPGAEKTAQQRRAQALRTAMSAVRIADAALQARGGSGSGGGSAPKPRPAPQRRTGR